MFLDSLTLEDGTDRWYRNVRLKTNFLRVIIQKTEEFSSTAAEVYDHA